MAETKHNIDEALKQVIYLLTTIEDPQQVEGICERQLGLSKSETRLVIRRAQKRILNAAAISFQEDAAKIRFRLGYLYRQCLDKKDTKTAAKIVSDQVKLVKILKDCITSQQHDESAEVNDELKETIEVIQEYISSVGLSPDGENVVDGIRRLISRYTELEKQCERLTRELNIALTTVNESK